MRGFIVEVKERLGGVETNLVHPHGTIAEQSIRIDRAASRAERIEIWLKPVCL